MRFGVIRSAFLNASLVEPYLGEPDDLAVELLEEPVDERVFNGLEHPLAVLDPQSCSMANGRSPSWMIRLELAMIAPSLFPPPSLTHISRSDDSFGCRDVD